MGISKKGYRHTRERGAFGTGQGSAGSMNMWGFIASRLITLHDRFGHGAKYNNPSGTLKTLILGMISFVDDCNLSNTGEKYETLQDILNRTQEDAQLWNDLIRASGGALELAKCFYQVINFEFGTNGTPFASADTSNLHLELIDRTNNKSQSINTISCYKTYKSLGKIQGISKNQKTQLAVLKKKAKEHTRALVTTPTNYHQAYLHHIQCFIPSVSYPLPVCHL